MSTPSSRVDATSSTKSAKSKLGSVAKMLGVVVLILILAAGAVLGYYTLSNFFTPNGTWYGPMHMKSGVGTVSVETYMNLTVSPAGTISGNGTFCIPLPFNNSTSTDLSVQGTHDFVHPGDSDPLPLKIQVDYAISLPLGFSLPVGPQLDMHGNVHNGVLSFFGGNGNVSTALAMKHGSKTDFTKACTSLSPLG